MKAQMAIRAAPPMPAPMPTCVVCGSEFHFWLKVCVAEGSLLPSRVRGWVLLLMRKRVVSLMMIVEILGVCPDGDMAVSKRGMLT